MNRSLLLKHLRVQRRHALTLGTLRLLASSAIQRISNQHPAQAGARMASGLMALSGLDDLAEELDEMRTRRNKRAVPSRTLLMSAIGAFSIHEAGQIKAFERFLDGLSVDNQRSLGWRRKWDPALDANRKTKTDEVTHTYETLRAGFEDLFDRWEWSPSRMPDLTEEERTHRMSQMHGMLDTLLAVTTSGRPENGIVTIDSTLVYASVTSHTRKELLAQSNDGDARYRRDEIGYTMHIVSGFDADTGAPAIFGIHLTLGDVSEPEGGREAIQRCLDNGVPISRVVADRGYTGNDSFIQWVVKERGMKLTGDLMTWQRENPPSYAGAIMVNGVWVCPSLPDPLRDIGGIPRRWNYPGNGQPGGLGDEVKQQWLDDLEEHRTKVNAILDYRLRGNGADRNGNPRKSCPDQIVKSVECSIPLDKRDMLGKDLPGHPKIKVRLPIASSLSGGADVCSKRNLTYPLVIAGRWVQDPPWGTKAHADIYTRYRNLAESIFGWLKQPNTTNGGKGGTKCIRLTGVGRITMLATLQAIGYNLMQMDRRTEREKHEAKDVATEYYDTHGFDTPDGPGHGESCTHHGTAIDLIDSPNAIPSIHGWIAYATGPDPNAGR